MFTGAQAIDGAEFLFSAEGIRQTGWVTLENGTFFYDPATEQRSEAFMMMQPEDIICLQMTDIW